MCLLQFFGATSQQCKTMWNRFELEVGAWESLSPLREIRNSATRDGMRLGLYVNDIVVLRKNTWLTNTPIDYFAWKIFDTLKRQGMHDVYKRFKFLDCAFMYNMYIETGTYNFNNCRRFVTKRTVVDGKVFSFLSHEKVFIPVNKDGNHWCLVTIIFANREIMFIDSLNKPNSSWHIDIYSNLLRFIQEYQLNMGFQEDAWAWHMRPIATKNQTNMDDCGVCVSMAIYCLVHGLDYRTIPPYKFNSHARLFMYYTCMGYKFDQVAQPDRTQDEVVGHVTIIDDDGPAILWTDEANRYARREATRRATNPPDLERVTDADLEYPQVEEDTAPVAEDSASDSDTDPSVVDLAEARQREAVRRIETARHFDFLDEISKDLGKKDT
jgi:hypothetical protein